MAASSTTNDRSGLQGQTVGEYNLADGLTLQDVDREVALALAGCACPFERREAGGLVAYVAHRDGRELGRWVLAPATRLFACVRVREVCPAAGRQAEFEALCCQVRRDLEALAAIARQLVLKENVRYSYPRDGRREIVRHYRRARILGQVEDKESWAQNNYHISRKTLWRYEREFPEAGEG